MCQYGEVREDKGIEHLCYTSVFRGGGGGGGAVQGSPPPPRIIILYLSHECLVSNNPSESSYSLEHFHFLGEMPPEPPTKACLPSIQVYHARAVEGSLWDGMIDLFLAESDRT